MNTRKQHGTNGFTLIELLGTIAIIAVIMSIGIGGAMKMSAAASRKETKARLVMLLEALDAYALDGPTGEYPKEIDWEGNACGRLGDERGYGVCKECRDKNYQSCSLYNERRMAQLLKEMETVEECRNLLFHLPDNAINKTNVNVGTWDKPKKLTLVMILDSYEQPIIILPHGGLGGPPTFASCGPDRFWVIPGADEDDPNDNIFADR